MEPPSFSYTLDRIGIGRHNSNSNSSSNNNNNNNNNNHRHQHRNQHQTHNIKIEPFHDDHDRPPSYDQRRRQHQHQHQHHQNYRKPQVHKRGRMIQRSTAPYRNHRNEHQQRRGRGRLEGGRRERGRSEGGRRERGRLEGGGQGQDRGRGRGRRQGGGGGRRERVREQQKDPTLKPIHVSKSSIHNDWKTELGGIIRYYINSYVNSRSNDPNAAMREIEQMYYNSGCDTQKTKNSILAHFGCDDTNTNTNTNTNTSNKELVDISMAIECGTNSTSINPTDEMIKSHNQFSTSKEGLLLHKQLKSGEGPAHAHETWTNIIVPTWAIGKSYFFQMENKTQLNLSCEMTIDGHSVARNVPIPPNSVRYVRPDVKRYFETHKWVIKPAKKFKLQDFLSGATTTFNDANKKQSRRGKERYNGIRPNYNNQRLDITKYPDPSTYGWTFTGSNETSKVEFFEKEVNLGKVRMDFYYTTATVKTTLEHPSSGMNALFRRAIVDPEKYIQILINPRVHTHLGYRRALDGNNAMDDSSDDNGNNNKNKHDDNDNMDSNMYDDNETNNETNNEMIDDQNWKNYYAKNDKYDFQNEGHINRASAMSKLEQTGAYSAWEEAARKEWACVHAKFYVSLPKKNHMYNSGTQEVHRRRYNQKPRKQEELPEQAPVVDIKAAEMATLGTKFYATGPSQKPKGRSKIVMKRINGLDEDETRRSAPVFEYKLYYRAEEQDEDDLDSMDADDEEMDTHTNAESTPAEKLLNENNLVEYKQKKVEQVQNWHQNCTFQDDDEATFVLLNRLEFIDKATTVALVDGFVHEYYEWFQREQWNRR